MSTPRNDRRADHRDDPRLVDFWQRFLAGSGPQADPVDVVAFGDATMADALADLVLEGTKRATAGSVEEYDAEGWRPQVGDLSIITRADGAPVAVVRTTGVEVGPLSGVTDDFAWTEGEGDRTREDWVASHRAYFQRSREQEGLPYSDDLPLVFERFEVVWPPEVADRGITT